MAHWRDGGIGNMPGSDGRPIEEWTLLEKLNEIASSTPSGSPMPRCLGGAGVIDWAAPLGKIASEAFNEIQRLHGVETNLRDALILLGETRDEVTRLAGEVRQLADDLESERRSGDYDI